MTGFLDNGLMSVSGVDTGDIDHSLRFRSAGSTYLNKTLPVNPGSPFTVSLWLKRGTLATRQFFFGASNGTNNSGFGFDATDHLIGINNSGSDSVSASVYRDPMRWLHIVIVSNGTTVTCYVDNEQVLSYSASIVFFNTAVLHTIGRLGVSALYFDGYISRFCFVDQALTPSSFGYLNTEINKWVTKTQAQVKAVVDAGGTNSFMLDFDNGTSLTTLGYDKSSKGNNWTLNGHSLTLGSTYDWMLDVPGNSYATLNPLQMSSGFSATSGNLTYACTAGGFGQMRGSMYVTSGKWYWEDEPSTTYTSSGPGVASEDTLISALTYAAIYTADGGKWLNGSKTAYGAPYTSVNKTGIALDMDASPPTITFYMDNSSQGAINLTPGKAYAPVVYDDSATNSLGGSTNFGQRPFTYTPPTGFKALCQANLPDGESITTSGTFIGRLAVDGPYVDIKGKPLTMTINGNAVTWGTHADSTAFGFKVRTASSSYNNTGSNSFVITSAGAKRKYS